MAMLRSVIPSYVDLPLLYLLAAMEARYNVQIERLLHIRNPFTPKLQRTHRDPHTVHQLLLLLELIVPVTVILQDLAISFMTEQVKPTYFCNFRQ